MKAIDSHTWIGDKVPCPNPDCDYEFDAASALSDTTGPSPGDVSVCAECTSFLVYTDPPHVRLMTDEEFETLPEVNRIELKSARAFLRTAQEKRSQKIDLREATESFVKNFKKS